tara:strand:+ start:242 stop:493 length:252 start_codon:yes stop_codon:yes gene_type:complete
MITNLIFILIAGILIFVLYLAVKAITRGVEAKSEMKIDHSETDKDEDYNSTSLSNEILKIKKLHDEGVLSDEEFKKAKDKIVK